jgi:YihY family inner membrane protein
MSDASPIRETRDLKGDDAWRTLAAAGWGRLLQGALARLRAADGFSHARSLAFAMSLVAVQGVIALLGLAVFLQHSDLSRTVIAAIQQAVPAPVGGLLARTFGQARKVGIEHRLLPLAVGLFGTVVTATTATGQIIRGINRVYGVEWDGPFIRKYARALLLALLVLAAFVVVGVSLMVKDGATDRAGGRAVDWPLVLALAAAAFGGILRWAPRRRQPRWSWLVFGGLIGIAGWTVVTVALNFAFRVSSSFGEVYGPLAGVVALQMWALLSAVAILLGVAVAAQLEAVRSGTEPAQRR